MKSDRLVILGLLILSFALRWHHALQLGVQADEGVHIVLAEWVAQGKQPYVDLFENRTVGVVWLLAAVCYNMLTCGN